MEINADIRARILAAADQLYEEGGRDALPTVDAVRRAARASMGDTSAVMKEWRRQQTAQAAPVAVTVPEPVAQANNAALAALWRQAQELAAETLQAAQAAWESERQELDALRQEVAAAYETQATELEQIKTELAAAQQELQTAEKKLLSANIRSERAEERASDIEEQASKLRDDLAKARLEAGSAREDAAELRGQLGAVRDHNKELIAAFSKK